MRFRPLYQLPRWLQRLYPGATWRRDAAVYLTFDDGPIPEVTPRILEILRQKQAKATFFVVGDNISKHPGLLEQIVADGHRVGNHTFHHLSGWRTPTERYFLDVSLCEGRITDDDPFVDLDRRLFRPPYGKMRPSQYKALRQAGYEVVLWDVLTHDYNKRYTAEDMLDVVKRYTRPGSIVVFHDSLRSGERMLEALPRAIDWWREQGYELKTL